MVQDIEKLLLPTLDALSAHIAVLSPEGTIIFVNSAWRAFAEKNGIHPDSVSAGVNYLDVCQGASNSGCDQAEDFLNGLKQVVSGREESFSLEYPCHSDTEKRWFIGKISAFTIKKECCIVVSHEDITERKHLERELKRSNQQLEDKVKERTMELEDMNAALKILLKRNEKDKAAIEEKILSSYESIILPFVTKLKKISPGKKHENLLDIIESNLMEVTSVFSKRLNDPIRCLTPTEIQIAAMVKQGLTNKEIADVMNVAVRTVTSHRDAIRTKLGIKNQKVNLMSYLSRS